MPSACKCSKCSALDWCIWTFKGVTVTGILRRGRRWGMKKRNGGGRGGKYLNVKEVMMAGWTNKGLAKTIRNKGKERINYFSHHL
jgi:hypothetical protein